MKNEINKSLKILQKGGNILYPTDTVWGIGCDATNNKAVANIFSIKKRAERKSFIILLDHVDKIKDYVTDFPLQVSDLIMNYNRPLTIVFPGAKNLARKLIAEDGSIAIRVVRHDFCKRLIKELGKPLVSTSANVSGTKTPILFCEISDYIKDSVNYVVNLDQHKLRQVSPSTVIKIDEKGNYEILRS